MIYLNQRYQGQITRITCENGIYFPQVQVDPKDYRMWSPFYKAIAFFVNNMPQSVVVKFYDKESAESYLNRFKNNEFAYIDYNGWVLSKSLFSELVRKWHFELLHWICSGNLTLEELQKIRQWLYELGSRHLDDFAIALKLGEQYLKQSAPPPIELKQMNLPQLLEAHAKQAMSLVSDSPSGNENYLLSIEQEILQRFAGANPP